MSIGIGTENCWREYLKKDLPRLMLLSRGDIIKWIRDILISKSLSNQNLPLLRFNCNTFQGLEWPAPWIYSSFTSSNLRTVSVLEWKGPLTNSYFPFINLVAKHQCIYKVTILYFWLFPVPFPDTTSPNI